LAWYLADPFPQLLTYIMATKRTCLIIGATTGIGKETAEHLARKGWTVIVTGRNQDKGSKVGLSITPDVRTYI
jgi:NAD(P)-dependent dehydrogenase (short-subunit alcohol dehydrogenase family)